MAKVAGFINRGAKQRNDLYFLNQTNEPAVLAEICFVDSTADTDAYADRFDQLCKAIAITLAGTDIEVTPDRQPLIAAGFSGKCSWFGGPDDTGVDPDEGLAFIYDYDTAPDLFLDEQPPGTSGLARRLDPDAFYVACRWDYDVTSKDMLADQSRLALVRAKRTGKSSSRTRLGTASGNWARRLNRVRFHCTTNPSLRPIVAERDSDHDQRTDCDHHRADKRQLLQDADNDRPDAESSLHLREAPACHTHRTSPFGPQQRQSDSLTRSDHRLKPIRVFSRSR